MQDPEVNAAFKNEELAQILKPEDRKSLNNFVYHLKSRRRKDDEEEAKRTEDEKQISEKGKQKREEFEITSGDVDVLKQEVKEMSEKVLSGSFWNEKCNDKDCQFCKFAERLI